jgi:4-amino-4-deoxy-L-arabinose transferase-like glycosyltransferase
MPKKYWLIGCIIIIAAFFRLTNLAFIPPGLYPDEAMNGNNAAEALATGQWKVFYPENNGREGLFINIQSLFLKIFGVHEPWVLRLPSAIFGILTVLGVYFLTEELFRNSKLEIRSSDVALLAAFLLATSFWHINFSRIGFRAIMAPFFLTWGVYLLLLSLRKIISSEVNGMATGIGKRYGNLVLPSNDNQEQYGQRQLNRKTITLLLPIIAGLVYGLGMHSYIAYRATPLLILFIIAAYWLKNTDREVRKKILLSSFCFLLSAIIVFLPLGIHFLHYPSDFFGRTTQVSVFNSPTPLKDLGLNIVKTLGMFNFKGDSNWRHNLAGQPELFWPVGIMFLMGIFVAIKSLIRNSSLAILFVWLGVASLPVVISNEGIPHALRAILLVPPTFIFAGLGGLHLYYLLTKKIRHPLIIRGAVGLALMMIFLEAYLSYFIRWGQNPNTAAAFNDNYLQLGRTLNSLPQNQLKYVIVKAGGVDVRGLPMPAQTVMFITDTFTPENQKKKNIYYLTPDALPNSIIPNNSFVVTLD